MEHLLCIAIGLFIVAEAIYIAANAEAENRYCVIGKHTGALMSGICLVAYGSTYKYLLFGLTIALFMWPETYFRLLNYLQINHPNLYRIYSMRITIKSRRKADYETIR